MVFVGGAIFVCFGCFDARCVCEIVCGHFMAVFVGVAWRGWFGLRGRVDSLEVLVMLTLDVV